MGLFKTIDEIVRSPYRSRTWKFIDVTFLVSLWTATAVCVAVWFDGHPWSSWRVASQILLPLAVIASARSWYRYPRRRRQRVQESDSSSPRL